MSKKVEILALVDRSGSMRLIMDEVVGAFNSFIDEQRKQDFGDDVLVSLAIFDDRYDVVYDHIPLESVPELKAEDVKPRGMTALHDSIAKTIFSSTNEENNVIVLIQTDGADNTSVEYNPQTIRSLVKEKEALGWEFHFIGSGLGEKTTNEMGSSYGIKNVLSVDSSVAGMEVLRSSISASTSQYRSK